MFLAQIHSIEDRIASLEEQMRVAQQQLQQYQNLREKAEGVIALLKEIQQQSEAINEGHNWKNCVMHALQISDPQPPTPQPPSAHFDTESQEPQAEMEGNTVDNRYSTPEELAEALENEDVETVLMEVANVLDAAPEVEIEGRIWYFVQHLPMELCDRMINYLPKNIIPTWREQIAARKAALELELAELNARASILPTTPTFNPDELVRTPSGDVAVYLEGDGNTAQIRVPGVGTVEVEANGLKTAYPESAPKDEQAQINTELEDLAKECLKLRSWSQIRVCCESNPKVIELMQQIPKTKTEVRLINNLPSLVLGYIDRTNDRSDLEWLPDQLLSEVEALFQQQAA
jgi:hypothetical protein